MELNPLRHPCLEAARHTDVQLCILQCHYQRPGTNPTCGAEEVESTKAELFGLFVLC